MSRGIHPEPSVLFAHGERYGQLTVLERWPQNKKRGPKYKVGCSCGRRFVVPGADLRRGRRTACHKCTAKRDAALVRADI